MNSTDGPDNIIRPAISTFRKEPSQMKRRSFIAAASTVALGVVGGIDHVVFRGAGLDRIQEALGYNQLTADQTSHFRFEQSPWEVYARLEEKLLDELEVSPIVFPRQTEHIIKTGDRIAKKVARAALSASGESDIVKAVERVERSSYIKQIAHEIAREDIFYKGEGLLSNSFNPELHPEGGVHLDCDLLTYLFMHCGKKHDVDMRPVPGPNHVYFSVDAGDERVYVMEPTEFRKIERTARSINYAGRGIGEGFFSSWEKQKSHAGIVAKQSLLDATDLHRPIADEQRMQAGIEMNILTAIYEFARSYDDFDLMDRSYQKMFEVYEGHPQHYLSASNAFNLGVSLAKHHAEQGEFDKALQYSDRVMWMRSNNPHAIVDQEPVEEIERGRIFALYADSLEPGSRSHSEAQQMAQRHLGNAQNHYARRSNGRGDRAINSHHADLLIYLADFDLKSGDRITSRWNLSIANRFYQEQNFHPSSWRKFEQSSQYQLLKNLNTQLAQ